MARVEVLHESEDKLSSKVYIFWLSGNLELYLDYYAEQSRLTKRHKYIPSNIWNRLDKRNSTLKEKPIIDDTVINEAIELVKRAIIIIK